MRLTNFVTWRLMLLAGMTAVLVGYFAVWLPGPDAGLRLIGVELGEWIKFLGVGTSRNLFYLPPILLGLVMATLSANLPNGRWQTWAFRILALAVSLLAFPAIAAIATEASSEWLARLIGIALVGGAIILTALISRAKLAGGWLWWVVAFLGLLGIILPLWQYRVIQPLVSEILRQPVSIGLGLWLNSLGFLAILVASVWMLWMKKENRPPVSTVSQIS